MCQKQVHCAFIFLCSVVLAIYGLPARDELMYDLLGDTAVVESTVRETRAAVPSHIGELLGPGVKEAYIHTYGDDDKGDGDVQGYYKKSQDKGSDGYQHYDSFHKKDGDKYGYEKHSQYGKADHGKVGTTGKSQKYSDADGDKESYEAADEDDEDGKETKNTYKVVENVNEDKGLAAVDALSEGYDDGYYGGGESEGYSDGEGESAGYNDESEAEEGDSGSYTEGGDGESENLEEADEGDSGSYVSGYDEGDSGSYTEGDGDAESGSYTAEAEDDGSESEGYTAADDDEGDY